VDPSRKLGLAQLLLIKDRNETGRKLESPRARLIRKASSAGLLVTSPAYGSQGTSSNPTFDERKVADLDHDTVCSCYAGSGDHVKCISYYASRISIQIMWMALV